MPRCTRAICIPATIKMGSETPAERIVNASNFERNGDGLLAIRLWRDYVIATLSIDGGIVFCFALASKLQRVNCGASARFSILCFEIGLGFALGLAGEHGAAGTSGLQLSCVMTEPDGRYFVKPRRRGDSVTNRTFSPTAAGDRVSHSHRTRPVASAINYGKENSRASVRHRPDGPTDADCCALRYNGQYRRGSNRRSAIAQPDRRAVRRALPR
jgi:hypothetical protein